MNYQYVASSAGRKVVTGKLFAESHADAVKILSAQGYRVYSLKPLPNFLPNLEKLFPTLLQPKIRTELLVVFARQLALLLESGTDIVTALHLLQEQSAHRYFKRVLGEVVADLRSGVKLSKALAKHEKIFTKIFVQSLSVGETGGNLEVVLRSIADHMEKDAKITKQVKGALKYPLFVSAVAFAVIAVLVVYVLPQFAALYTALGTELPAITKFTLSLFGWLTSYGIYIFGSIAYVALMAWAYGKTSRGRLQKDRLLLKIPVIGQANHLFELVRCCRTMGVLYKSGLPIMEILTAVTELSNNMVIKKALDSVRQDVLSGASLSKSMAKSPYFLPMMVQMVSVGEASGNLDVTLAATAENFETEARDSMQAAVAFIQPAITLLIAVIVGFIAVSLVAAMYSMYGQASG
jgi:type IV pilus assembly protein PilC